MRLACIAVLGLGAAGSAAAQVPAPRGTIIVSNMQDHTATIIDAGTGYTRATLPTGQGPHEVAVTSSGALAIVSNYGTRAAAGNSITVIDVAGATVVRTLKLEGFTRPHGMSVLPGDTLAAVTSEARQMLLLVDLRDGRIRDSLPTKGRASHMVAVTADGAVAYTANVADASISRIELRGGAAPVVLPVGRQPEGIAVAPDGRQVWVGSNQDSTVTVLDPERRAVIATLRGFGLPYRMTITPDGTTAVISDPMLAQVRIYATKDRSLRFTVAIPAGEVVSTTEVPGSPAPEGIAISRDSRWAFVTLQGRNRVVTIDLASGETVGEAVTGTWSDGVAFSPVVGQ